MNIKETKFYIALRKTYHALKNWEKTYDDLKLYRGVRPLKDIHKGQACVLIGNGPSLKEVILLIVQYIEMKRSYIVVYL